MAINLAVAPRARGDVARLQRINGGAHRQYHYRRVPPCSVHQCCANPDVIAKAEVEKVQLLISGPTDHSAANQTTLETGRKRE